MPRDPNNPNNRDLIVRTVDDTADNMHMLLDLPANLTDAQILALTQVGRQRRRLLRSRQLRVRLRQHATASTA